MDAQNNQEPKRAREALTSKPWFIYVTYKEMVKREVRSENKTDILIFTEDTINAEDLAAEGYSEQGATYQVSAGRDGSYKWQAIMLHENQADTVFLTGVLKNGVMNGLIIYQPQNGPGKTCNFTTARPVNR